MQTKDTAYYS